MHTVLASSPEIAHYLYPAVQLRFNPGAQLLDAASRKAHQMLHQYTLQELSHTLWALAVFEHHPGRHPLAEPAAATASSVCQTSDQCRRAILVMLCTGIPFLDSAAEHITRKIEQFSPQDAANAVWAYARLFHYPQQAFLRVRHRPRVAGTYPQLHVTLLARGSSPRSTLHTASKL